MNKKSIKKNYIYNLLYQLLNLIAPLVTTPYISRVLGADGIGDVSFAESIVAYFTLFAVMGITTYGQREISYHQESKVDRSIVFWNTKVLEMITAGVALVVYLVFAVHQKTPVLYLILSMNILAVMADVTWLFQGMEEFGVIVFRNIVFKIINIGYVFLFVRNKDDILIYAFGHAFFLFVSNLSLWFKLPKMVSFISISKLRPFRSFKTVMALFVPTIAIQIYTVLDKTMIGIITQNSYENGFYEQAIKISKMVLVVVTALGTVMIPRIGYYFNKGDKAEIQRLMYRGYRFVWMLGIPLCFGLIAVSSNFVPWFFGAGYEKVADLINILAFLILAIGINNVTGMQYLIPTKRENTFTVTVIIGACVNFILNSALIYYFASTGAAIASVAAEAVIAVVQIYIVRKELNPVTIIKEGVNYYIAGGIMLGVLLYMGQYFSPSIINTGLLVCIGGVIYASILFILKDQFVLSNMKIITGRVLRK